jgi:D-xylose transport system substrate-binding protein
MTDIALPGDLPGSSRRLLLKRGLLMGAGLTALPGLLAACGNGGGKSGGASGSGKIIGLSLGTLSQRRWQFDKQYIEEAAKARGMQIKVQSANNDSRLQASQVENLLAQNIDVLILSPIDVKLSALSVNAAKAAKVPVVSYNSIVQNADIDYWVARDNVAVGRLQAELAVKAVPKGNYVIVSGEGGVDIAQQKTQGNLEVLKPYIDRGDIKLVSQRYHSAWDAAKGLAQVEDALSATGGKIDAILCNYDGFVVSAMGALKSAGLLGKTWIGGEDVFKEVAQAIDRGEVAMSAFTPLKTQAGKAVEAAAALASQQTPKSTVKVNNGHGDIPGSQVQAIAVTKDSMCKFLSETGWLAPSEVFVNPSSACS